MPRALTKELIAKYHAEHLKEQAALYKACRKHRRERLPIRAKQRRSLGVAALTLLDNGPTRATR